MCATLLGSFATDYLSSPFVQALDPEQELWYVRLMLASVISDPPGCVPIDNSRLWRLAKAPSLEYFELHCGPILAQFERNETAGFYRAPKWADELMANAELSRKRTAAGKRGAARRWASEHSQMSSNPDGSTVASRSKKHLEMAVTDCGDSR